MLNSHLFYSFLLAAFSVLENRLKISSFIRWVKISSFYEHIIYWYNMKKGHHLLLASCMLENGLTI